MGQKFAVAVEPNARPKLKNGRMVRSRTIVYCHTDQADWASGGEPAHCNVFDFKPSFRTCKRCKHNHGTMEMGCSSVPQKGMCNKDAKRDKYGVVIRKGNPDLVHDARHEDCRKCYQRHICLWHKLNAVSKVRLRIIP